MLEQRLNAVDYRLKCRRPRFRSLEIYWSKCILFWLCIIQSI